VVDQVICELKVAPTVLVERGEEGIELCLGETDDVSSSFFPSCSRSNLAAAQSASSVGSGVGGDGEWTT